MKVEVACALPGRQEIVALDVEAGCTVGQAIELSGIRERFPEVPVEAGRVGVFGEKAGLETVLREGDRVEIYRPLIADPKEARKKRALKN